MSAVIKNVLSACMLRSNSCILRPTVSSRSLSYIFSKESTGLHQPARCACNKRFNVNKVGGVLINKSQNFTDKRSPEAYNSEKELSQFLLEEIEAEKKLQKGSVPKEVCGFSVKADGSEVVLTKKIGEETIEVCFNVNHTVDCEDGEIEVSDSTPEMKSKPNFEVEITRGGKTLGFSCSIIPPSSTVGTSPQEQEAYNDLFSIDEVVMYSGQWKETNYSARGDVLDGTLYDILMDLLEDKGINNDFIEQLMNFSTAFEHSRYITMLQEIQQFCSSAK